MATLHHFAISERGIRETNENAFCAERIGGYHVFAIAGGMAGKSQNRGAGQAAIDALRDAAAKNSRDPVAILEAAVTDADQRISALSARDRERAGMSTDLCACLVDENMDCTILDTGNGSVYYISPGSGIVIPRELPFSGKIPVPSQKKIISHALGEPHILRSADFNRVNLMDSFIVMSSDGLYDFVKREEIRPIVERNGEAVESSCEELKDKALLAGSGQTITVIVIHGHSR